MTALWNRLQEQDRERARRLRQLARDCGLSSYCFGSQVFVESGREYKAVSTEQEVRELCAKHSNDNGK